MKSVAELIGLHPDDNGRVAKVVKEDAVEGHLVKLVGTFGGDAVKMLGLTGWPDRQLLWPWAATQFVETKKPRGSVYEPRQLRIHARLRRMGFTVDVAFTKAQADAVVLRALRGAHTLTLTPSQRRALQALAARVGLSSGRNRSNV